MEAIDSGACRPWGREPASLDEFFALLEPPWWHATAACRGSDVSFFPTRGVETHLPAVEVCRSCPVRAPCLAAALRFGDIVGVWGGTTQRERRRMRAG